MLQFSQFIIIALTMLLGGREDDDIKTTTNRHFVFYHIVKLYECIS